MYYIYYIEYLLNIHIYIYICVCVYVCVCMRVCVCVCVCLCVNIKEDWLTQAMILTLVVGVEVEYFGRNLNVTSKCGMWDTDPNIQLQLIMKICIQYHELSTAHQMPMIREVKLTQKTY